MVKKGSSSSSDGEQQQEVVPIFGGKGIPNQRLDFRFNHAREEGASVLTNGRITYKEIEMMKADALGLGGLVNIGDTIEAGDAQLRVYVP